MFLWGRGAALLLFEFGVTTIQNILGLFVYYPKGEKYPHHPLIFFKKVEDDKNNYQNFFKYQ